MSVQPGVGYTFKDSSQGTTLTIEKPWAPWAAYPTPEPEEPCAPFKVKNVKTVTVDESTIVTYDICPGTINNLMPQVFNATSEAFEYLDDLTTDYRLILDFDGTSSSLVYLRVGPDASSPYAFPQGTPIGTSDPDDPYPRIYSTGGALPADTDTLAYLLIAKVNALGDGVYSVDQYVTGSLWADRIKINGMTARYYYARI
jgi:hypothetical protein